MKPKPIVARACIFSRALCRLLVITSSFDWFTVLSPSFLIGESNYFGFGFTTLDWNSLSNCVCIGLSCTYSRLPFSLVAMTCSFFCYQGLVHCFCWSISCFVLQSPLHTEPAPTVRAAVKTVLSCQSCSLSSETLHFCAQTTMLSICPVERTPVKSFSAELTQLKSYSRFHPFIRMILSLLMYYFYRPSAFHKIISLKFLPIRSHRTSLHSEAVKSSFPFYSEWGFPF